MTLAALRERLERSGVRRIAVLQTAFLGDTVFTSALCAGLAARFPQARLAMVVSPRGRDVARAIPAVRDVLVYDKRGADRGLAGFARVASALRALGCDLAVLPHRSIRTALLAWRAGIPERLGFRESPGRLACTALAADPGGPFLEREAALLEALGAPRAVMKLVPAAADRAAADELLAKSGWDELSAEPGAERAGRGSSEAQSAGRAPHPLVQEHERLSKELNMGTQSNRWIALALGSEWETKIWPADRVAALARRFAARGLRPLLLGGPRERAIAAEVSSACPEALDTTGNPVGEALALLERSALCIGGDTGLTHAARALGVPALLLFGPTDPKLHALGPNQRSLWLGLDCSPCGPHGARRCPLGHHRCLRDLSVDEVEAAALGLLAAAGNRVRPPAEIV